MVEVIEIDNDEDLQVAFRIRSEVFIEEQQVPREEEYDAFEDQSIHFLATEDHIPCGTCRWRFTPDGVKLERFAVLKAFRKRHVGSALMTACLDSIAKHKEFQGQLLYLNAQISAGPLYTKFGFEPVGFAFMECDIVHQKMVRRI